MTIADPILRLGFRMSQGNFRYFIDTEAMKHGFVGHHSHFSTQGLNRFPSSMEPKHTIFTRTSGRSHKMLELPS